MAQSMLAMMVFIYCLAGLPAMASSEIPGSVIRVGPDQAVRSISAAAAQAQDGDVIEVEAGDYPADVAVWARDRITVRGVGGRFRLFEKPHQP